MPDHTPREQAKNRRNKETFGSQRKRFSDAEKGSGAARKRARAALDAQIGDPFAPFIEQAKKGRSKAAKARRR